MNVSDFTEQYLTMADDEVLCLWAERETLVPEAALAIEGEVQRRGLKKQHAARVKKRLDALAEREGPMGEQVAAAKYKRNMRHFIGWEEPKFYSPYGARDIRTTFAFIRHKYKVWKAFRDHTGRWPVLSIWFHFLSWLAVIALGAAVTIWVKAQNWGDVWSLAAIAGCALALLGARESGARMVRKLDWTRYGTRDPRPEEMNK